ncbi:MAG: hypothetical protein ABWZ98_13930 [Nakamurella sp.]
MTAPRRAFTVLTIIAMGSCLAPGAPVAAQAPSPALVEVLIDPTNPDVTAFSEHSEGFGEPPRDLIISTKTQTLRVQSAEFVQDPRLKRIIRCDAVLMGPQTTILKSRLITPAGTSDTVRLAVRPLTVVWSSGTPYRVTCTVSGGNVASTSVWTLASNPKAGRVVSLTDSVHKQHAEVDRMTWSGSNFGPPTRIRIAPGGRMLLTGPVGFWHPYDIAPVISAELTGRSVRTMDLEDVTVSADGAVLGLTIPATIPSGSRRNLSVVSSTYLDQGSDTTPVRVDMTLWSTDLAILR